MDIEKLPTQEFTLEADSEFRFEIEKRNRKVIVEVSIAFFKVALITFDSHVQDVN